MHRQSASSASTSLSDLVCLEMEETVSSVYRRKRLVDGSIAPQAIRVVQSESGTFQELMDYAVSHGTSISQYKFARCASATESSQIIELLDSRVVSSHFSFMLKPHALLFCQDSGR